MPYSSFVRRKLTIWDVASPSEAESDDSIALGGSSVDVATAQPPTIVHSGLADTTGNHIYGVDLATSASLRSFSATPAERGPTAPRHRLVAALPLRVPVRHSDNSTSESIGKPATTLEDKRSPHVTGRWSAAARSREALRLSRKRNCRRVDGSPTVSCFRLSSPPTRSIETGKPVGLSTRMDSGSFRLRETGTQARSCS